MSEAMAATEHGTRGAKNPQPHVLFIGTGGTISNAGTGPLDYLSYLDTGEVLDTPDVLAMLPDVSDYAQVSAVPFGRLRSKAVSTTDWHRLAKVLNEKLAAPDVDGAVVAHGTGVLEETAYFLHLTLDTEKPVVLVGAQRPPRSVSSDAALNFVDAVRVAASTQAHGLGVVVVMDQTIHSARDVTKAANHATATMDSPFAGLLGRIKPTGAIDLYRRPLRRHTHRSEFVELVRDDRGAEVPRVDIVYGYAEADGVAIDAFRRHGARGLVVIGFAPGTNPPGIDAAISESLRSGVRVVQATRAYREPTVNERTALAGSGLVLNDSLTPQHARVLLQLALVAEHDTEAIQADFRAY